MGYLCSMIMYNVTINVDESIHEEWLRWMKEVHIPDVMATGMFTENRICRIEAFEQGGISFAIQYIAPDREYYDRYQEEFAPKLQKEHTARYQGKFAAFRTTLEVIHQVSQ